MKELIKYVCEVCGAVYEDRYACLCHETNHRLDGIFDTGGTKLYANGNRLINNNFKNVSDFLAKIDAIEVANPEAARAINKFFDENKYLTPFDNMNSKRVCFDDYRGEWIDADETVKNIKAKFGE